MFQSTRPVRGATHCHREGVQIVAVSIHAPRAGRDSNATPAPELDTPFQSTRPVRGAT